MSGGNRRASAVLDDREVDALVDLFLWTAKSEDRRRLMANLPLVYAKLFPTPSVGEAIKAQVTKAINEETGIHNGPDSEPS